MDIQSSASLKRGKAKEKVTETKKPAAAWDAVAKHHFLSICVDLVESGNKPGTALSKYGYEQLIKRFNEKTGRSYVRKQFKNHWDALKKDWSLWKQLTHGETGLGMDHNLGTIDASDEWWEKKLKIVPEASKFRTAPLANLQELEKMFGGSVATGEKAWTPNSGVLPPHMVDLDAMENENIQPLDDIEIDSDTDNFIHNARKRAGTSSINIPKKKKISAASKLTETLDKMIEFISTDHITPVLANEPTEKRFTTSECINVLNETLSASDPLYGVGLYLFHCPTSREIFLQIPPEARINWLKTEYELAKK